MKKLLMFWLGILVSLMNVPAMAATSSLNQNSHGLLTHFIFLIVAIIVFVIVVAYVWAQIRQFIPAHVFAKLPRWLAQFLECIAANCGHSKNAVKNSSSSKLP